MQENGIAGRRLGIAGDTRNTRVLTQENRTVGGVRWLGMSESSADRGRTERPAGTLIIGDAHGPRLLELLRAS